jgi:hypothetical protein
MLIPSSGVGSEMRVATDTAASRERTGVRLQNGSRV